MKKACFAVATLAAALSTAFAAPVTAVPPNVKTALATIDGATILANIKTLASDDFEGRAPGTKGEASTVAYLREQFIKLGLKPGNPDGSYQQRVPMIGTTSKVDMVYRIGKGKSVMLKQSDDFVAWSPLVQSDVDIANSELVFVGYGVQAPEYGWDDYKGVDLKGKTIVMLINDPAIPDPKDPGKLDPAMFKGDAMTYYGRWTYKYEMAVKMGAVAAIIVHETKPAAYPFEVVRNSWSRENFNLKTEGANPDFPSVPAWIQLDRAKEMFSAAGLDFDTLKKSALSKNFKPVSLGGTIDIHAHNTWREIASNNVVAKVEGSDPKLRDEVIVYSAHWDHFGINEALPGPKTKQIFHGALDNASGTAALLELAKAYQAMKPAPKRTILFVATTAEEQGLLGAKYYAQHPLYPLQKTLANINIDGVNPWGRTTSIEIISNGYSTIDDVIARHAHAQGRSTDPNSHPDLGGFYRADQLEFARVGVPVLYTKGGSHFIGKPDTFGHDKVDDYVAHDYHKVSDTVQTGWDFSGAVEDIQLLFLTGYDLAQGTAWPQWNKGTEFKAKRDAMMAPH